MGVAMIFVGYIQEAWPGNGGENEQRQWKAKLFSEIMSQTDQVISALPEADEWPPLSRGMFGWPPPGPSYFTYESRVIHFGASMKNVDFVLRDWLDKFESLLRKLAWEEAYVRVEQGYIGPQEFRWTPSRKWIEDLKEGHVIPITEWEFTTTVSDLESLREAR